MSTRATYGFSSSEKPDITLYIHHDGYPEGAAIYVRNALQESGYQARRKLLGEASTFEHPSFQRPIPPSQRPNDYFTAEGFIRANDRAEIARSHERHGDTEYRYDFVPSLKKRQHDHLGIISLDAAVILRSRINFTDEWDEEVFTLREFLIKYGQEETVELIEEEAA